MIKWLKENNCPWDTTVFGELIKRGDLNMLVWAYDNYNCSWDGTTCETLSLYGDHAVIQWAISKRSPSENIIYHSITNM